MVKIKDVYLTVVNSDDVMSTKALMSGFANQVPVEGFGNMNFTLLMEVMFKVSAYVLCGKLPHRFGNDEHMMLKIPMSAENEMESQYSISDIEIGKVNYGITFMNDCKNELESTAYKVVAAFKKK